MQALILASGTGSRLKPITESIPKPLVKINEDKTIIDHQLENLIKNNITNITITTGPFQEKIKKHLEENYPKIDFNFIHNPKYAVTNYIYSLWLARKSIIEDVIFLHGDLLFEEEILSDMLKESKSLVVVKDIEFDKDFKARIENELIKEIGVNLSKADGSLHQLYPLYKLVKKDFGKWMERVRKFIKKGKTNCYAEDAYNEISDNITLRPYYTDRLCLEIDTHNDLEEARRLWK